MNTKLKHISLLSATVFLMNFLNGCNLPVANLTGDQVMEKDQNLIVQANISMDESNINSLAAGQISDVLVSEGDIVTKDQQLVVLDSDSVQAQKDSAEAAVTQAEAGVKQAQSAKKQAEATLQSVINGATQEELDQLKGAVEIAKSNIDNAQSAYNVAKEMYERYKALYDNGSTSKAELEAKEASFQSAETALNNAKSNLDINNAKYTQAVNGATAEDIAKAQSGVDQAQASIEKAEGALAQAKASVANVNSALNKCTLSAPIDGIVKTVNVKNGDVVSSGMPSVVITDIYNPYITCNVNETDLSKVELGQEVTIKLPAYENQEVKGKVVNINKNADFATKKATNDNGSFDILSYGVKVEFEDMEELDSLGITPRADMTVFVDFGK